MAVARAISCRLLVTDLVPAHLAETDTTGRGQASGDAAGIAGGDAGLALLAAALEGTHPGEGWAEAGLTFLRRALSCASTQDCSLFSGLAGAAFSAHAVTVPSGVASPIADRLEELLLPRIERQVDAVRRMSCRDTVSTYDLVSGLAGQCVYLMTCVSRASLRSLCLGPFCARGAVLPPLI